MSEPTKLQRDAAGKLITEIVLAANIPGLECWRGDLFMGPGKIKTKLMQAATATRDALYFSYEQAWGVSCTLTVRIDDGGHVSCVVDWSTTSRNMSSARASIRLYTQVLDLGCLIEAHMADHKIETDEEHWKRMQAKYDAQHKKAADEYKKGLYTGTTFTIEQVKKEKVPRLLWTNLEGRKCGAQTRFDGKCCVKGRLLVWNGVNQQFVVRCGRHKDRSAKTPHDDAIEL